MSNYGSITITLQVLFLHQITAAWGDFPKDSQIAIHYMVRKKNPNTLLKIELGEVISFLEQRHDLLLGQTLLLAEVFLTLLRTAGVPLCVS